MRGAFPRGRGVAREGVATRVEGVLSSLTGVSEDVFLKGLKLYNQGQVHETGLAWVYRVGSVHGGLYGYEVDLSAGTCSCKGFELGGRVCKHLVAAGAAWIAKKENA